METKKYLDDINEIKNLMNRSSRFISLSGLSGVLAGVYAILGAAYAYSVTGPFREQGTMYTQDAFNTLKVIALTVAALAIVSAFLLTNRKAKKQGESIWNSTSKRLMIHFLTPLLSGGVFCLILMYQNLYGLVAPATLIFYGLACFNAAKYTLGDIRYLGISCVILGLLSGFLIGYGLLFWTLGFGVCHIIYGTLMYFKYDKK